MSYTPPFIPRADAAFLTMASNFARNISRDPARYMMAPAEAAAIMADFVRFDAAYAVSIDPETRTRGTIIAKDDARFILRTTIRNYAAFIRPNLGIPDGSKVNIGVPPRNIAHKHRRCPGTPPLLNFTGSLPGIDQLVYHDSNTPNSKAKPYGAERLELWRAYSKVGGGGGAGGSSPKVSEASFVGSFKKSKMLVDQDMQLDSRMEGECKPTYWARWAGFDGSVGPWSLACRVASGRKQVEASTDSQKDMARFADELVAKAAEQSASMLKAA